MHVVTYPRRQVPHSQHRRTPKCGNATSPRYPGEFHRIPCVFCPSLNLREWVFSKPPSLMQPHVPTTTAPRVSRRDLGMEGPFASQRRKHERIPGILRFPRSRNVQPDMQASSQPRTAVRPKASVWGTTRIPFYAATCASLLAREPARATCTGNDRSQDDERRMEDMVKHITPCSMSSPVAPHVGPKAIVCVGRQASPCSVSSAGCATSRAAGDRGPSGWWTVHVCPCQYH